MEAHSNRAKKLGLPLCIALLILVVTRYFAIQHIEYTYEAELICASLVGLLYSIRFFAKKSINLKDAAKWIMVTAWSVFEVLPRFTSIDFSVVYIILMISTSGWMILEIVQRIQLTSEKVIVKDRVNRVLTTGVILLSISYWMMFSMLPGSTTLQITSLLLCSIGFYMDFVNQIKNA